MSSAVWVLMGCDGGSARELDKGQGQRHEAF